MEVFEKMVTTQLTLFAYMAAGFICRKIGIITDSSRKYFNAMLTKIALPCTICASFLINITAEEMAQAGLMLVVSACICLLGYGIALLLFRKTDERRRGPMYFGTMFSNAGNAGLPVVSMVFGELGVLYTSFFLIPIRVFMWTLGLSFFNKEEDGKSKWKKLMLNPCLLAVFVGLGLTALPFDIPSALQTPVRNIGSMVGPLSMMIIGSTLTDMKPVEIVKDKSAWALSALRLVLIPLVVMGVMRLLNLPEMMWQVAVVITAMPVATLTVVFAETSGGDHLSASRCVILSTLLSLVTVPLLPLMF
ncbi:MAG: AEC family transporter [Clostridiales bacterium]|nr:AEC family transporter [Clostridiales bacterium]